MAPPRRDGSLTRDAYDRLRADLVTCRLRPGERLNIKDLCQRLSVSLGAVREALARLTSDGLVLAEPQRGFRAAPVSAADLADLTEARLEIEGACLARAIVHGDLAWETGLVAAHHQLSRTPHRDADFALQHRAFHEALAAGCDSAWLLRLRGQLYDQIERYGRFAGNAPRDAAAEHERLVDAALRRDAARAASELAAHIRRTAEILRGGLPHPETSVTIPTYMTSRIRRNAG